ncbi:hypothetical protein ColTof4_11320 [Colletotrichum tofieldiae]|nr:hypothetical protein ColTof3_04507 [Colletotrichum tofieldiae]GKT78897.1 hypothetical protein ColTof4_11320 [Colletotrichum tofieldiae]
MQRAKESAAEIMRQKQAAGESLFFLPSAAPPSSNPPRRRPARRELVGWGRVCVSMRAWDADGARAAEARKTAEGAGGSKKK